MATMYPLFFGLLLIAVCSAVGTGDGFLTGIKEQGSRNKDRVGADMPTRVRIIRIAAAELGIREATGHNDGKRVEEYLRYTHLDKGHPWCAAFVSWCYGQAGLSQPRNPWSPALFPKARTYGAMRSTSATIVETQHPRKFGTSFASLQNNIQYADIFGIYSPTARRINHVGLVKGVQEQYLITIEGNSSDKVESRRRHLSTIYALADWIGDN